MITVEIPFTAPAGMLACGADLKGAFALAKGKRAFLVDGFGNLSDPDNLSRYDKAVRRYLKELRVTPKIIACDLHPGYFSTEFAQNYTLYAKRYTLYKVQHHEAHIASAVIDNSITGKVIGVAFDGTGFGSDGNIWGGEFFIGDLKDFKRPAHFKYIPMPGSDMAVRQPWRMAVSYLYDAFGGGFTRLNLGLLKQAGKKKVTAVKEMIGRKIQTPLTSSAGRLFDAVSALVLSRGEAKFEAELPIELEKMAAEGCEGAYSFDVAYKGGIYEIDVSRAMKGVVKDLIRGVDKSVISAKFHNTVADLILDVALKLRKRYRLKKIVLSGGVFQNKFLSERAASILRNAGFKVYTHSRISTNDLGIPLGQIGIAAMRPICA